MPEPDSAPVPALAGDDAARTLRVSAEVCEAFSGLRIAAVVAEGFRGTEPWPEVDAELAALEAGDPLSEDDPHIAAWHAAYRAFGTNPKRERPSVDALRRRLARSGRLPRINPAVDCYNLVSVSHAVPAGAFDLDAVQGDITVRFATGGRERGRRRPGRAADHPVPPRDHALHHSRDAGRPAHRAVALGL